MLIGNDLPGQLNASRQLTVQPSKPPAREPTFQESCDEHKNNREQAARQEPPVEGRDVGEPPPKHVADKKAKDKEAKDTYTSLVAGYAAQN